MNIIPIDDIPQLIKQTARPFDPTNEILIRDLEYVNAIHSTAKAYRKSIKGRNSRIYRYLLEDISRHAGVQHGKGAGGYGLLFVTAGRLTLADVSFEAGEVKKLLHRAGDEKGAEIVRKFTNDHLHTLDEQCRQGIQQGKLPLEQLYWQVVENNILVQVAHFEQRDMDQNGMAKKSPDDGSFGSRLKAIGINQLHVLRPKAKGLWFVC